MEAIVVRWRPWRTLFVVALLLAVPLLLFAAWVATCVEVPPLHLVVDGQEVASTLNLAQMPPAHKVVLVVGVVFAVVLALMVVPLVLLAVAGLVLLGTLLGVGLPVLVLVALGTVAASPLILMVLFAVWLLRKPRSIPA